MSDIAQLGYRVDTSGLVKGEKALNRMGAAGDKAEKGSKRLYASFSKLAVPVAALSAAIGGAILPFAKYQTALAEVNTLLGADQNINDYSKSIRELSKQFGTDQSAQAKAFYNVISAGASSAAEATSIMASANKLALGGVTDIATASDGLTSVLNAYSLDASEAGKVSDILFATMKSGKTTVGELSGSLGKVAPIASQVGVGLDELNAAIATITKGGVSTVEAVTQVKAALSNVLKPSKEAADLAADLGINFSVAGLKAQGFSGFIQEVATKTGGSEEQLAKLFGSIEAVQAIMPLAGAKAGDFANILDLVKNSAGSTDEAVAIMSDTLTVKFNKAMASLKDMALTIGDALSPAITFLVDSFQFLLDVLSPVVTVLGTALKGIQLLAVGAFDLSVAFADSLIGSVVGFFDVLTNNAVSDAIGWFKDLAGVVGNELSFAFNNSRLVGIAMVRGVLVSIEKLKYGFGVSAAFIKMSFVKSIDVIRKHFAGLFESIAKGLRFAGFDDMADGLDGVIKNIKGAQTATQTYNAKIKALKATKDNAIKSIITITDEMAEFEIATKQTTKATVEQGESSDDTIVSQLKLVEATKLTWEEYKKSKGVIDGVIEKNDDLVKSNNIVSDAWEDANRKIFDSMQTFFRDGLDGWDNFGDSVKDIVKDMIASILAQITQLLVSNAFKKMISFLTGGNKFGGTGLFDGIGELFGGKSGGGGSGGGGLGSITSLAGGIKSATSAIGGWLGMGSAAVGAVNVAGSAAVASSMAASASMAASMTSLGAGAAGAGSAGTVAFGGHLGGGGISSAIGAIPGWGWAALAAAAVLAIGSGARTPQELGEDQLQAVDDATKAGRNTQVQLGSVGGVATSFLGGFDENSTFFGVDLLKDELQKVGDVLKNKFGFDQALALKDGVIRLEDFSREFSENNEEIVAEVQASILIAKHAFDDAELAKVKSLGKSVVAMDRLYDQSADSGKSAADRLKEAYMGAFGASEDAATTALANMGLETERLAQIFDSSSNEILATLTGVATDGLGLFGQSISEMGDQAQTTLTSIEDRINGVSVAAQNSAGQVVNAYDGAYDRVQGLDDAFSRRLLQKLDQITDNSSVTRGNSQPLAGI